MKKFILSAAILFGTTLSSLAQLPSFNLGIKGGVNYSKLKSKEDFIDANSIMGYQVGAWARLGGAGLYVQPELYLGSKGGKSPIIIQNDGTDVETKGKVKFTTLDLPILLGTKIGPNKFNLRFMAGPVVSFIVDQKTTTDVAAQNVRDYKNQALGLQAGTGVDLGSLSVDLRYEAGLSKISKSPKYDQKQNLFHLSLGFKVL
ncbi:MAG TPA: porin family protein [Daejeonella sp.]|nr:porin family protein [Daejeonella sp.]